MCKLTKLLVTFLVSLAVGCGGGSNNDQGTGLNFLGWNNADPATGVCKETFTDGLIIPMTTATDGGGVVNFTCATARNNLCTQGIRVDRVYMNFHVPGSTVEIPDTTNVMSTYLAPQTCSDSTITSSLPPGMRQQGSKGVIVDVVPHQIREFISTNRNRLPEAPFNLDACATLSGVTSSGDRIESNELCLHVIVSPDVTIDTPVGSGAS